MLLLYAMSHDLACCDNAGISFIQKPSPPQLQTPGHDSKGAKPSPWDKPSDMTQRRQKTSLWDNHCVENPSPHDIKLENLINVSRNSDTI